MDDCHFIAFSRFCLVSLITILGGGMYDLIRRGLGIYLYVGLTDLLAWV
jgi:hypothetical protein